MNLSETGSTGTMVGLRLPPAVPEIPVGSIVEALAYYRDHLGFEVDWGDEEGGIGGISRDDCRIFLTNTWFRSGRGNQPPILIWLNLDGIPQVDHLYAEWVSRGATIVSPPERKPWGLYEFTAADPDGNQFRV